MCVLLVEDEPLIREVMAESLLDAGFEVFEAVDGRRALDALKSGIRIFSIVVTDFHMPGGIDGSQVAAEARSSVPRIPVIIVSGRPDVLNPAWLADRGLRLLRKPYLPSTLVSAVRAMVEAPAPVPHLPEP